MSDVSVKHPGDVVSFAVFNRSSARHQYRAVLVSFVALGLHVGVWAVQLAELVTALTLSPGSLGLAITISAIAGLVTLFAGGLLADRLGRRPVMLVGFGGTAAAFSLLSQVRSFGQLVAVIVLYGLCVSFIDLGVNTIGADLEHAHGRPVMTRLHAGFSAGAAIGALGTAVALHQAVSFRLVYLVLAAVLAAAAVGWLRGPLPHQASSKPVDLACPKTSRAVWRIPGVAFAITVLAVAFFTDGALESFLAIYLTQALGSGILLSGIGIAAFHLATLLGLLIATRTLARWGERRTVAGAGLLSAVGIAVAVTTDSVLVAILGLLIVGLTNAPIAPTALSLAGRSAPGRSGQAVALTTAGGYGAFIISPALVGGVADLTSLRTGLALLVITMVIVMILGLRWPRQEGDADQPETSRPGTQDRS